MTVLTIVACLATGECREFERLYDARQVSVMTCIVAGQAEVARWRRHHPRWRIRSWRCARRRQSEHEA